MRSKKNVQIVNWSRNLRFRAAEVFYPESIEAVAQMVERCVDNHQTLRVLGSKGSQVPFADSKTTILSLERMNQVTSFDRDSGVVAIEGGVTIKQLIKYLEPHGYTIATVPGVTWQTMAGAISTDTHGVGPSRNLLHHELLEVTLVDGRGEVRVIDRQHQDFSGVAVSLGLLGVIVSMRYQCIPSFEVSTRTERVSFTDFINDFPSSKSTFCMYSWVVGTESLVRQKCEVMNDSDLRKPTFFRGKITPTFNYLAGNLLACIFSRLPQSVRAKLGNWFVSDRLGFKDEQVSNAQALSSTLICRLNDVEMACDIDRFPALMHDLVELVGGSGSRSWPLANIRFAKSSSAWLSLAEGRDTAYISFWFRPKARNELREAVFQLMRDHQVRPHWGKLHDYDQADLVDRYSNFDNFKDLMERCDPHEVFMTDYCRRLFQK